MQHAGPTPMLCIAISDRAPPRCQSILGRWLVDLRIVGQLALTGYWTTHAAARPPPLKLCTTDRYSPLEQRAAADLHGRGQFGATRWLSTIRITERRHVVSNSPGRHYSAIGLKARSCQTVDRMCNMVVVNSLPRAAPDTQRVTGGLWRARSRRSGAFRRAKRKCATTQMRTP